MKPTTSILVPVGGSAQTYQIGNFINALDNLVCFFSSERADDNKIADALEMYARHLRGDGA